MGAKCDWNERGGGPSEKMCERRGKKFSSPSERRGNVRSVGANLGRALRGECAGKEQREQKERDAPELAP
jgi:hypothetical protein